MYLEYMHNYRCIIIPFSYNSNMSVPHCQTEKTNGRKLPKFWDWVQHAHYAGNITVRDVAYDHWVYHVSDGMLMKTLQ